MELTNAEQRLLNEFAGIFSPETIEECVRDSARRWADAPIQVHVPILAERFARDRLRAAAHVERTS